MSQVVTAVIREGISFGQLTDMLKEIVTAQGCPACGLNGWDLRLQIDPIDRFTVVKEKFSKDLLGIDVNKVDLSGLARPDVVRPVG